MQMKKGEMKNIVATDIPDTFGEDSLNIDHCIVLHLDNRGNILRMNRFGQEFLGIDEKTVLGKSLVETLLPEKSSSGDDQRGLIKNLLADPDKIIDFECDVRHGDGSLRRITWTTSRYIDAHGQMSRFICIGISRQAFISREKNIYAQYDLLESFLETSKVWAFAVDDEHRFFYVSPGVQANLGYSPEEVIGHLPGFLLDEEESIRVPKVIDDQIRQKDSLFNVTTIDNSKDGTMVWAEITNSFLYNEKGEFTGLIGLNRNIDAQKKAEETIVEREEELRYILDHAQVLLIVMDESGIIRSINQAGAHLYDREPEDMLGHVFTEFLPEFEREQAFQAFQHDYRAAIAKKATRTIGMSGIVNKISTPNGLRDILFYKTGVKFYREEQLLGLINTGVDITDIVSAREELKGHQENLERLVAERTAELESLQETMVRRERLVALGKLAGRVSHEIRNPLGTISSSLYVINEHTKEKEPGIARPIERADRAVHRCNDIIEEFLDFTRVHQLRKKTIDMDTWLNDLLDESENYREISLTRHFNSGASVEIDPDRLQRVLINILDNAKHAVEEKGEGCIVAESRMARNRFEIVIKDTGVGIGRETLEKVFEPLYSTKAIGVGLGLLICRQIVEQHGGGIDIDSEKGKGTTVLIWFPVNNGKTDSQLYGTTAYIDKD